MSKQTDLAVVQREQLAVDAPRRELSPYEMIQAVIEKGITPENAVVLEKLVQLAEHMDEKKAEREFNAAFVALQKEMPRIQATKPVPNNDGTVRYIYAPYEEIMEQALPYVLKNGFSIAFNQKSASGQITQSCILMHSGGHSRTNDFTVRIGQGPPKATENQSDGSASTYAKRFALCNCLNIVIERGLDNDARNVGTAITKEQAESLRARVRATASDEAAFLKYAKAANFEEIQTEMYAVLDSNLRRKEKTN